MSTYIVLKHALESNQRSIIWPCGNRLVLLSKPTIHNSLNMCSVLNMIFRQNVGCHQIGVNLVPSITQISLSLQTPLNNTDTSLLYRRLCLARHPPTMQKRLDYTSILPYSILLLCKHPFTYASILTLCRHPSTTKVSIYYTSSLALYSRPCVLFSQIC